MADFKYEIVEHIALFQRVPRGGQKNLTRFHGMVENLNMILETGCRDMKKWVRV